MYVIVVVEDEIYPISTGVYFIFAYKNQKLHLLHFRLNCRKPLTRKWRQGVQGEGRQTFFSAWRALCITRKVARLLLENWSLGQHYVGRIPSSRMSSNQPRPSCRSGESSFWQVFLASSQPLSHLCSLSSWVECIILSFFFFYSFFPAEMLLLLMLIYDFGTEILPMMLIVLHLADISQIYLGKNNYASRYFIFIINWTIVIMGFESEFWEQKMSGTSMPYADGKS